MLDEHANWRLTRVMRRVCAHEKAAMKDFYEVTSPLVFGAIIRLVHGAESRAEALVATYREAWHARGDRAGQSTGHVEWLLGIAHREALRARESDTVPALPGRIRNQPVADSVRLKRSAWPDGLKRLDESELTLIASSYLDGRPASDLATQLGIVETDIPKKLVAVVRKLQAARG